MDELISLRHWEEESEIGDNEKRAEERFLNAILQR